MERVGTVGEGWRVLQMDGGPASCPSAVPHCLQLPSGTRGSRKGRRGHCAGSFLLLCTRPSGPMGEGVPCVVLGGRGGSLQ